jgi:tRNA (guanine37-N1)-methyltransferase
MRIDILTLFPEMLAGPFDASIIGRARQSGAIDIAIHNPRDYTTDKHHVVDDYAYGGGPGMVMKPEPLFECVDAVQQMAQPRGKVVLLTPQGRLLDHRVVAELAREERLIVICGHYEGVDERVREHLAEDEISIGDYVLSGGEPAAIVLVDAVARHQPGVLGSEQSLTEESHAQGLLEYPQYTRPGEYRGLRVPDALLSGHHAEIERWRRERSIERTARRRPDMLRDADLTSEERRFLESLTEGERSTTRAHLFRVIMPVADHARGVAFYAQLLGHPGELVAPNRHYFKCGGTILAVVVPGEHAAAADGASFRPNVEHVYFAVPDLKERYAIARKADCSYLEDKIRTRPWGEKSFYAQDPFGNPICFVDERTVFTGVVSDETKV